MNVFLVLNFITKNGSDAQVWIMAIVMVKTLSEPVNHYYTMNKTNFVIV